MAKKATSRRRSTVKKFKILVVRGTHAEGGKVYKADGSRDGNIVETPLDLVKIHGAQKFQYYDPQLAAALKEQQEQASSGEPDKEMQEAVAEELKLGDKSEEDLMQLAEEEEIDISGAETREDMERIILEAMTPTN